MLISELSGYPRSFGLGAGAGESVSLIGIREMQKQLRRIAVERNRVEFDPAQYDGKLTLGTIMALANAASSAANIIGKKVHPIVGKIVDVFGQLRGGLGKIPYAGQVISIMFSPWLIDKTWGALLGIMRVIPGGSKTASTLEKSVDGIKQTLGVASAPIAAALALVPKAPPSGGLGDAYDSSFYRTPVYYNPTLHGPLGGFSIPGVSTVYNAVKDVAEDAVGAVTGLASDAASAIKKGADTAWDYTSKAAKAAWDAAKRGVDTIYTNIRQYGCALVNNEILVTVVAAGAGVVATPAASAAIAGGAGAGKAACAAMAIGELIIAILRLLKQKFDPPPSLKQDPGTTLPINAASKLPMIRPNLVRLSTAALPTGVIQPQTEAAADVTKQKQDVASGQLVMSMDAAAAFEVPKPSYVGCFVRFNRTKKLYSIYCPTTRNGLGEAPAGTTLTAQVTTKEEAGQAKQLSDESDPIYKRPWFWIVLGGAAATTTFFVIKR